MLEMYYRRMENLQLESSNHLVPFGSVSPRHQFSSKGHGLSKGHGMKWDFFQASFVALISRSHWKITKQGSI
jgi:hypothetical protein